MEFIEGNYKSDDGKDYYEIALNLDNGEKILIKNAGCTATALSLAMEFWNLKYSLYQEQKIKIFFIYDITNVMKSIPKKYHKFFIK